MRRLLCGAGVLGWLVLSGCARHRPAAGLNLPPERLTVPSTNAPSSQGKLIITADQGLSGKVASVNANLRFVVLTFPIGQMPSLDQRLNVYHRGLKVGEVKVCGPRQEENIVADIIAGQAEPDDTVSEK